MSAGHNVAARPRAWGQGQRIGRRAGSIQRAVGVLIAAAIAPWTSAQTVRVYPTIAAQETLTSNANVGGASGNQEGDLVTQITPGVVFAATGAHSSLLGSISVPILLYARSGEENNRVRPQASLAGSFNAWDRRFVLDASAIVSQQYLSPFGARPADLTTNTANEYTSATYRVMPSLRGETAGRVRYELRDDNIWTTTSNTPVSLNNAYTNDFLGRLRRDPDPLGWGAEYHRNSVEFTAQKPLVTQVGRVSATALLDPQVELSLTGGYEDNDYLAVKFQNAIYGAGVRWRPSDRTTLDAAWEHRFFGSSYHVEFANRTPLTVWNFRAAREATSYPQQVATLSAGRDVSQLLNSLLTSRVPDPALRQQTVDSIIQERGLPAVLSDSLILYDQRINIVESVRGTVGLLGARNSVFLSLYRYKNQPIADTGNVIIVPGLTVADETVQTGMNVVWSRQLSGTLTMTTNFSYVDSKSESIDNLRTKQGYATLIFSRPLSPNTVTYFGARYQELRSSVNTDYEEAAVFAGVAYRLH
jgi:uncharacterized protein (PEP-CTERM system associated)